MLYLINSLEMLLELVESMASFNLLQLDNNNTAATLKIVAFIIFQWIGTKIKICSKKGNGAKDNKFFTYMMNWLLRVMLGNSYF